MTTVIFSDEKPILDYIRELQEDNYKFSEERVGKSIELFNLISSYYDYFGQDIKQYKFKIDQKHIMSLTFLLSCQYQLIISTVTAMRGHLTDSLQSTRRAVEIFAFAHRFMTHPHLIDEWRESYKSKSNYSKYLEKFSTGKLFPKNNPLLTKLYARYDACSKQMHATIYSMSSRIKFDESEIGLEIKFNYFEIDEEDVTEPIRTLLYIWDTHGLILRASVEMFQKVTKGIKPIWDLRISTLDSNLSFYKNMYKDVLLNKKDELTDFL